MKKYVIILLVLVMVFSMSAIAFADNVTSSEQGNTNVNKGDGEKAPQTGDTNTIFYVIAAIIVAAGVVLFCGKKLIREK